MKKVILLMLFLVRVIMASEYDKEIVVKDQSRDDKVVEVFKEMMQAYEEENLQEFFSFISEDRFNQDYMTFYDAISTDFRVYDILSVDTWTDKITEDGVKRYLYVRWDKRYESASSATQSTQRGYSRFLFDEINGEYKLIELAGNNFWGGSLPEWREEVPQIAGQEDESQGNNSGGLPDLIVENGSYNGGTYELGFDITNIGTGDASNVAYSVNCGFSGTYAGTIFSNSSTHIIITDAFGCSNASIITIDPDNFIEESDELNNMAAALGN